jgi:hypothetical protein
VYNNVRVNQPPQKVQESAENLVQEDLVEDILTESIATKHASSNGKQTDLQNVCRELVADVGDTAADATELSELCDTGSHQGNTDEYEDIKLTPSESYMVATDTWEYLPNGMCRLCASADEHPKQSIVGWLHMLNEVIPDLVSYLFLFIDLCTFASLQNMYRYIISNCNTFNFILHKKVLMSVCCINRISTLT